MKTKGEALEIFKLLSSEYKYVKTFLSYDSPFNFLTAVILSAQCTDKKVNEVTKKLFAKYKTIDDYVNADINEFEQDIKSTGFYKNKAKNIIAAAGVIKEKFKGRLPDNIENMITIPGVGRKTANIALNVIYDKNEGIAVDTHVKRISQRIGLTENNDPDKIEQDLMRLYPKEYWKKITTIFISHGRNTCIARKPLCEKCIVREMCESAFYF